MLLGPIPANWDFGKSPRPQTGLMVLEVKNNSPMTKQGIARGTVITKVAGKTVSAISDLQSILHQTPAEQCSVQLADTEGKVAAAPAAAKD
jgi:S1-C subfamily serine protease